jgi:hypothetical protein
MPTLLSLRIIAFLGLLIRAASAIIGNNGVIQTIGVGQYCTNYFNGLNDESRLPDPCNPCDFECGFCHQGESARCPWNCNNGCTSSVYYYDPDSGEDVYSTICSAGCVSAASCTPIANGEFTGIGTVGDSTSCDFRCNAGYTKTGRSCVAGGVTCPNGQYNLKGVCTACRTCTNGYYLSGCTGSNAGDCIACTNTN